MQNTNIASQNQVLNESVRPDPHPIDVEVIVQKVAEHQDSMTIDENTPIILADITESSNDGDYKPESQSEKSDTDDDSEDIDVPKLRGTKGGNKPTVCYIFIITIARQNNSRSMTYLSPVNNFYLHFRIEFCAKIVQ